MKRCTYLFCLLFAATASAEPFTYQGQLSDGGSLVNGDYDFIFKLYDGSDPNTATLQGSAMVVDDLPVSDGVFTATIDPGILFDGTPLWLEVSVRPGNSTGSYTQLSPLQPITAAPEAQVSLSVVADSIGSSQIVDGSVADVDLAGNIDPTKISGTAWTQSGNSPAAGAYLGTNNTEPLVLRVNGKRVGVITDAEYTSGVTTYHAPNVVLGAFNNEITADYGATISGGRNNTASGNESTVAGGYVNTASGSYATVGGGKFNTSSGPNSTIGGGNNNTASGTGSTACGGAYNSASELYSTIGGGSSNNVNGERATIGGGSSNSASNKWATVGGGNSNIASGFAATVGGGGGYSGGNTASGYGATVAGGQNNIADGYRATVSGGYSNAASGGYSMVGGGDSNTASGSNSTVPGGSNNQAGGSYSFAAGFQAKVRDAAAVGDSNGDEGTFVWADSIGSSFVSTGPNQFLVRANGGMGVGTNSPRAQLHVKKAINSQAYIYNHVAIIENNASSTTVGPDVLALKTSAVGSDIDDSVNFITFFDGDDIAVGRIEGNGSTAGGVAYFTSGADFAEYLPTGESDLQPGEVVGLNRGRLSRDTEHAERVLVISGTAAFVGAAPPEDKTGEYALAAFMGQVPVKLHGEARPGDWLVASGKNDGHAVARSLEQLQAADMTRVIGRALKASRDGQVKALVGLPPQALLAAQQKENELLKARVVQLENTQQALLARLDAQQQVLARLQNLLQQVAEQAETTGEPVR